MAQLAALQAKLQPMHDYLHRLRSRMARQRFAGSDPLMKRVTAADDAIGTLCLELAAMTIELEVGPAQQAKRS